jgi:prepilin-type N-terminal cleavage/methylation domain-containing protein
MTRTRASEQGFTLIESMLALAIVMIGAMGVGALFTTGVQMNGDARRMTHATAIAQDLLNSITLWPYNESTGKPLANTSTGNDGDIGDAGYAFQLTADPLSAGIADHGEADLTALGTGWTGLPASELRGGYERYWNVRYVDSNGNGVNDLVQIAVIVRWPHAGGWRRVVLMTAKLNPGGS